METLKFKDLQQCDVLLCRGEGLLSDIIVLLDGGTYSHAALYAGEINGQHSVFQATTRGIVCDEIEKISCETFVDVFRFQKNDHKLGEVDYTYAPILEKGQEYVDSEIEYAYDHLIFLAGLIITRDIPLDPFSMKILRIVLDRATELILKLIDDQKTPMVCSELVYRCFDEADINRKYALSISAYTLESLLKSVESCKIESTVMDDSLLELKTSFYESKEKFIEVWNKVKENEQAIMNANINPVAACITPKDLETCKDLIKIGRLSFD